MIKYSTWVYYKNKTFIVQLLKAAELSVQHWLGGRDAMNSGDSGIGKMFLISWFHNYQFSPLINKSKVKFLWYSPRHNNKQNNIYYIHPHEEYNQVNFKSWVACIVYVEWVLYEYCLFVWDSWAACYVAQNDTEYWLFYLQFLHPEIAGNVLPYLAFNESFLVVRYNQWWCYLL